MRADVIGMRIPSNVDGDMDDLLGLPVEMAFLDFRELQRALLVLRILGIGLVHDLAHAEMEPALPMCPRQ